MAIAPTATISNITGVAQSIEPTYQNIYVKSNLSGEFTVVNEHLVRDLKALDLWDEVMVDDLKYFDGSARQDRPHPGRPARRSTRPRSRSSRSGCRGGARRQKWIDQAQSLNIYMAGASGKKLDETYKLAWRAASRRPTTCARSRGDAVEKSTLTGRPTATLPSADSRSIAPMAAMLAGTSRAAGTAVRHSGLRSCRRRSRHRSL